MTTKQLTLGICTLVTVIVLGAIVAFTNIKSYEKETQINAQTAIQQTEIEKAAIVEQARIEKETELERVEVEEAQKLARTKERMNWIPWYKRWRKQG